MKIPAKAFTHGGKFHADDVFSAALLRILRPDIRIQRGFEVPENFDGLVFDIGDGMQGMIGVLGPTRMDYAQITARLSYFAENLGKMFQKSQTPALDTPKKNDPEG